MFVPYLASIWRPYGEVRAQIRVEIRVPVWDPAKTEAAVIEQWREEGRPRVVVAATM